MKKLIDADVIMPVTAPSDFTYFACTVSIRTCAASTSARIWVLDNNSSEHNQKRLKRTCELLGVNYRFVAGPFSWSRFCNLGTQMTTGAYICYSNADIVFFQDWFENIIDLWEENPDYFALATYTFSPEGGSCARDIVEPIRKIVWDCNPCPGLIVLKRSNNYLWDEQFPFWQSDMDFAYFMQRNNLKAGYCLNARADHLGAVFRGSIDDRKHFGFEGDAQPNFYGKATDLLRKKWGLSE